MSEVDQMSAMEKDAKQMYVFKAEETKTRSTGTNGKISESGKNKATDLVNKMTSQLKPKKSLEERKCFKTCERTPWVEAVCCERVSAPVPTEERRVACGFAATERSAEL